MYTLFIKEVKGFLNSLIGYVVIAVFLIMLSLFMWIFEGDNNIMDAGYANIDTLFVMAPWVFLFLVPAVTMRLFADEKKLGTIELLVTKPLTDLEIVIAKFFAGVVLVLIALLPTIIYYYSIYMLGNPVGNVDTGAILGSYIGLFLLASAFVSIGVFSSSITENQIIAFIVALFLCFFCYLGFDSLASLGMLEFMDSVLYYLGINQHYTSLSRGVIDTRDVLYFSSLSAIFILLARTSLESRKW